MFAYMMLGINDLPRAVASYAPLIELLGQPRVGGDNVLVTWGSYDDYARPGFSVGRPVDGQQATAGNGSMLAFATPEARLVDELYRAAMAGGGICEEPPGTRPSVWPGFYAAYVRDPDGNKVSFACYNESAPKTANPTS
jgi:catechol 2,3-dioxygenase-like lactoylglutathione lyase family enzyme